LPAGQNAPIGTTPQLTSEALAKYRKHFGRPMDPELTLELVVGRPRLFPMVETPFRIQVANDRVLEYNLITEKELSLQGLAVGTTLLNMWFGDPTDYTKQEFVSILVIVLPDPEQKERLERVYKALEDEINRAFPDSYVCLFLVADKLVVAGQAKDIAEMTKILQVIRASTPATSTATLPLNQINLNVNNIGPDGLPRQALENFLSTGETNFINLMRVPGEQQVMLRVTLAEINRKAARNVGLNFTINSGHGVIFSYAPPGGMGNIQALLGTPPRTVPIMIEALRTVDLAKTLAEPNLVTLNGAPAFFFAGGEFPVPIITGATAVGLQGVSFIPFGIQLQFTPFITDHDRIRISVFASISTRSDSGTQGGAGGVGGAGNAANFGANIGGAGGTNVPGLNVRQINTTVEMREGQTLAIGGLIETDRGAATSRIPLFGDLPFGGQLFRSDSVSAGDQELVLLVTPELVHPMEPKEIPALPGSDYFEPGDLEFFLYGRLESRRAYDYRSTVMDDIDRMAAYRHCELLYFAGPSGHADTFKP
jgi:pilus assembly protein CpaC